MLGRRRRSKPQPPEDAERRQDAPAGEAGADSGPEGRTEAKRDTRAEPDAQAGRDSGAERSGGEGGGSKTQDLSDTPAPSVGPHTTFEREDPEERLARHEQSDVDAMGLDKRREVIGGSYGPSFARQATMYGLFVLVVAALAFGAKLAIDEFDKPPEQYKDAAPWTDSQRPPAELQ